MSLVEPINVNQFSDLAVEFQRFASGAPDRINRLLENAAVQVADTARPLVPRGPSGAARASLKADTSGTPGVEGGGRKAPYYPWLEFGGRVGRKEAVRRGLVPGGRFIWPAWVKERTDILSGMERALGDLARESGF